MTRDEASGQDGPEAGERLEWRVWPAAQRPVLSVVVAAFGLVLAGLAIATFGSAWYGFITLIVLALALKPHYLPSQYALNATGVRTSGGGGSVERVWEAFRLAIDLHDRVILSPLSDLNKWVARRRSVVLRVADNHDEVVAFVARHVPVKRDQEHD